VRGTVCIVDVSQTRCTDQRTTLLARDCSLQNQHTEVPTMSHRPSSIYGSQQSSTLQSRINQKRAELENLRQLRDLSSQLATQMTSLEEKLATLRDGTEAVSEVLKNWSNVLGVLQMVGSQLPEVVTGEGATVEEGTLPGTLVRIPVEQGEEKGTG